jgi:hypothetical protein
MVSTVVITSLCLPTTHDGDLPPLAKGLLEQCATAELLTWLLEATACVFCGEHIPALSVTVSCWTPPAAGSVMSVGTDVH